MRVRLGVERHQLFHQPAAGRSQQPQLASVMHERNREHARLLQQITIKPQRRHHIAGIVGDFGKAFAVAAQRRQRLHDLLNPSALDAIPVGTRPLMAICCVVDCCYCLFDLLHELFPFPNQKRAVVAAPGSVFLFPVSDRPHGFPFSVWPLGFALYGYTLRAKPEQLV